MRLPPLFSFLFLNIHILDLCNQMHGPFQWSHWDGISLFQWCCQCSKLFLELSSEPVHEPAKQNGLTTHASREVWETHSSCLVEPHNPLCVIPSYPDHYERKSSINSRRVSHQRLRLLHYAAPSESSAARGNAIGAPHVTENILLAAFLKNKELRLISI